MDHFGQRLLAVSICAAILAPTRSASAQPRTFVEGLSELTAAVAGTYGDEGARVGPALDKMASGLAQWDREIQAFERHVASETRRSAPAASSGSARTWPGCTRSAAGWPTRCESSTRPAASNRSRTSAHFASRAGARRVVQDPRRPARRFARVDGTRDPIAAYTCCVRGTPTTGRRTRTSRAHATLLAAYRALIAGGAQREDCPVLGASTCFSRARRGAGHCPRRLQPGLRAHRARRVQRGDRRIPKGRGDRSADHRPGRTIGVDDAGGRRAQAGTPGRSALAARARRTADDSSEAHRVLGLIYWTDSQYDKSIEELAIAIQTEPARRTIAPGAVARAELGRTRRGCRARAAGDDSTSSLIRRWRTGGLAEASSDSTDSRTRGRNSNGGGRRDRRPRARSSRRSVDWPARPATSRRRRGVRRGRSAHSPNDPTVHKHLAGAFLQQDRADEAFVELVAALLIDPLDAGAHAGIGQIHLNAGRYDEARAGAAARRRAAAEPHRGAICAGHRVDRARGTRKRPRGSSSASSRRSVQMVADRRRNMALDVVKEEAALRAAEGNYDRAAALWQQAIDREPGRAVQSSRSRRRAGRRRTDRHGDRTLRESAHARRGSASSYRQLAELYAKVGRIDDAARARAMYERALQGDVTSRGTRGEWPRSAAFARSRHDRAPGSSSRRHRHRPEAATAAAGTHGAVHGHQPRSRCRLPPRQRREPRQAPGRNDRLGRAVLRLRQRWLDRHLPGRWRIGGGSRASRGRRGTACSEIAAMARSRTPPSGPASGIATTGWAPARATTTTTAGSISTSPTSARTSCTATAATAGSPTSPAPRASDPRCGARAAPSRISIGTETSISSSPTTWPPTRSTVPSAATRGCGSRFYCHPLNFEPLPNIVYRNDGNGVFSDVSAQSGVGAYRGNGLGVVIADFDDDRWPEVFVANDSMPNFLFHGTRRLAFRRDRAARRRGRRDRRRGTRRHGHRCRRLRRRRAARPRRDQSRFRDEQPLSRAWAIGCSRTRRPRAASARRRFRSSDSAWCSSTSTTTRSSISAFANGHIMDNAPQFRAGATYAQRNLLFRNVALPGASSRSAAPPGRASRSRK